MQRRPLLTTLALLLAAAPLTAQQPTSERPVPADTAAVRPARRVWPGQPGPLKPAGDDARERRGRAAADSAGLGPRVVPAPVPAPRAGVVAPQAAPAADAVRDTPRTAVEGKAEPLHLGLELLAPIFPRVFRAVPGRDALWLRPRLTDWAAEWAATARRNASARVTGLAWAASTGRASESAKAAAPSPDATTCCTLLPPPPAKDTTRAHSALVPGALADVADIGMKITGRGELGSAWTRYYPCDPSTPMLCKPSLFPQLKPDIQFGLQVGGTISDRLHLNVDFDERREFDAANNINVYYQGFDDEVLKRVEVGDVSIRLPTSRYLTQGIPAGNFGFKATGQLGPMDFQAVFAQQKGDVTKREFRLNGGAGQSAGLVQDANLVLDDGDYAKGQFFFIVNPDSLRGAPHLNILQLLSSDAPQSVRPAPGALVLYRDERISPSSQAQVGQLGTFLADASTPGSATKHSGFFRRLQQGEDYIVHPSGLWIVLRAPLRQDEALAMGYLTERGDTVGSINADGQKTGTPLLRLLRGPLSMHQPGSPTWPYEMHQVYRLDSSSGVDVSTVDLKISLGQLSGGRTFTDAAGKQITFLKLLGLDELTPVEQLDGVQIYQPSPASSGGTGTGLTSSKVGGTFLVFPTLRPFEAPPPVPSAGLSAAAAALALGTDANRDIYENPDPVAREAASRFRLNFTYRVKVDGVASTLNLGALGIREGSEKIYVAGKQLESGKDYTIDYDIGSVTLADPQGLFAGNPSAEIRATWEQKAAFQLAPTSIFGLNTRYSLGGRGELNLIGLYQAEKSLMTRPQLGTEPSSIFLGGASGHMSLGGAAIDALLSHVPGMRASSAASLLNVTAEAAVSSPNPNTRSATYVDDFEAGDETPITLSRYSWKLGSVTTEETGAQDVLPAQMDVANAMSIVWQHDLLQEGGGIRPAPQLDAIDHSIRLSGGFSQQIGEPDMAITLGGDSVPSHATPERRWRSLTTVLSTTGRDLSRSEYLEFYAAPPAGSTSSAIVIDLGTVAEDAYYYDSKGETHGRYPNTRPWGLGEPDQEVDIAKHEIWGTASDSLGLWDQECHAERGTSYRQGDPRANCTKGNGLMDTEDLNGDGLVSLRDDAYFRYVVKLGAPSPYLVRDQNETGTGYRLYRIPLRGAGVAPVNATEATWRFIKHLRLTVVDSLGGSEKKTLWLAHMRIIGSRWAKRDLSGIQSGKLGNTPLAGDTSLFRVGPASSLSTSDYASPPNVLQGLQDPTSQFGGVGQVINEKSLRLAADRLAPDSRAEAYYRYPQQPRSFMNYRQMRLWALARRGIWGSNGDQRLLVKIGNDNKNYYLYQARLADAQAGKATTGQWLPELVIDFDKWFALRAEAEQRLLTTPRGTEPLVVWDRDSTYAVVMEDRARAPNLAAVREVSFAVYNGGMATEPTEVWIDDLRLTGAMTDPGFAGNATVELRAGDFLNATASVSNQGALYHQLNQEASYQRTSDASLNGTAQLAMLTPASWDLDAPLTFSLGRTNLAPQFLSGTDVPTTGLVGLRASGSGRTRVGFSLRRRTPISNPWLGLLLEGTALRFGYTGSADGTATSKARSGGVDGALTYDRHPSAREFGIVPGFVVAALRALLPKPMEESDAVRRLTGAKLRWSPEAVSFSTSYYNQRSDAYRYEQILQLPTDTLAPTRSARLGLDQDVRIGIRPLESLTAQVAITSNRDMLPAERASEDPRVRQAIAAARGQVGGVQLGWEAARNVSTQLDWRPPLASWLRPGLSFTGRFRNDRSPSYLELQPLGDSLSADSTARMQFRFDADRQLTRSLRLDPTGAVSALFPKAPNLMKAAGKALNAIDLSWTSAIGSHFDRAGFSPVVGYQLGLGSFDSWRFMQGDTAGTATTRDNVRGRTGVSLPFGTELTASYDNSRTDLLDVRGGQRTDRNTTWPALQLTWTRVPIPPWIKPFLRQMGISGGYQRTVRSSLYGATAVASSGSGREEGGLSGVARLGRGDGRETSLPLQVSLGLFGSLSASYNGTISSGSMSDPTGDARKNGSNHTLSMSGFFKPPASFRGTFPNPIQATLGLSQQGDRQCRVASATSDGVAACTPFVDYTMRRMNLSLDTDLGQLTVGFQASYNARKSNIGTLNGSNQFQLGIFGQFNINAGQLPGVGR